MAEIGKLDGSLDFRGLLPNRFLFVFLLLVLSLFYIFLGWTEYMAELFLTRGQTIHWKWGRQVRPPKKELVALACSLSGQCSIFFPGAVS